MQSEEDFDTQKRLRFNGRCVVVSEDQARGTLLRAASPEQAFRVRHGTLTEKRTYLLSKKMLSVPRVSLSMHVVRRRVTSDT